MRLLLLLVRMSGIMLLALAALAQPLVYPEELAAILQSISMVALIF
jgi:hypothetical protein